MIPEEGFFAHSEFTVGSNTAKKIQYMKTRDMEEQRREEIRSLDDTSQFKQSKEMLE